MEKTGRLTTLPFGLTVLKTRTRFRDLAGAAVAVMVGLAVMALLPVLARELVLVVALVIGAATWHQHRQLHLGPK